MKKFYSIFTVVVGALVLASCSSNSEDENNSNKGFVYKSFIVSTHNTSASSRAIVRQGTLNDQAPYVDWQQTDKLSCWSDNNQANRTLEYKQSGNYANYATFSGLVADGSNMYYVLYPQQDDASFNDEYCITATIPATQYAYDGSFDPAAAICTGAAGSTATSVTLDHACSYLKITTTKACQKITVTASTNENTKDWKLAGKVIIEPKSAGSVIKSFVSGETTVTLIPQSGKTTITAGTYLIAVASSTHFPGITVKVQYNENSSIEATTKQSIQFASGAIYNLGTAPTTASTD